MRLISKLCDNEQTSLIMILAYTVEVQYSMVYLVDLMGCFISMQLVHLLGHNTTLRVVCTCLVGRRRLS